MTSDSKIQIINSLHSGNDQWVQSSNNQTSINYKMIIMMQACVPVYLYKYEQSEDCSPYL